MLSPDYNTVIRLKCDAKHEIIKEKTFAGENGLCENEIKPSVVLISSFITSLCTVSAVILTSRTHYSLTKKKTILLNDNFIYRNNFYTDKLIWKQSENRANK